MQPLHVYPPAALPRSPPLSWADIFVGTRGASRFSERPCKVKNKTAESPLAWTWCLAVGAAQTWLRPRYCSRVVTRWLGAAGMTPRRRDLPAAHAKNNSEGLTCAAGLRRGRQWGPVLAAAPQKAGGWPLGK